MAEFQPSTARQFRGGATLLQYQVLRFTYPLLLIAASDELGAVLFLAPFVIPAWIFAMYACQSHRSSVEIDGGIVRVNNPLGPHEFRIDEVTLRDTQLLGLNPGRVAIIGTDGHWVRCFGLGRRLWPLGRDDLQEFKEAVLEQGGEIDPRRALRFFEKPTGRSQK